MHWRHSIPFLRIFIPFLLGLVLYHKFPRQEIIAWVILFIFLGVFIFFETRKATFKINYAWLRGLILLFFLSSFGYLIFTLKAQAPIYFSTQKNVRHLIAEIKSSPQPKEKNVKYEVAIIASLEGKKYKHEKTRSFLYLKKNEPVGSEQKDLAIGDRVLVVNKFQPIKTRGNPGEFDYASFCKQKGIYEQIFLKDKEWMLLPTKSKFAFPFDAWSLKLREILIKYIPNHRSAAIAQALMIGYRHDIDPETYQNYTKTGLVHLIAISGLHMGLFYFGFFALLGLLPWFQKKQWVRIILSLALMWIFALLTSLPPSVLRAAIMFTFLGFGQILNRNVSSLNFLFASAMLLLIINPYYLFDVGFQLSYAAVLSIFLFYKPLKNLLYIPNKILRYVWELTCISLAAQILTLPIAVFYFHQMPTLFLLSNLVAIPIVTIVIYGEILLIVLSFLPFLANIVGKIISWMLEFLNRFIDSISQLSFVQFSEISLSFNQLFVLYAFIFCLGLFFIHKSKKSLPIALFLLLIFLVQSVHLKWQATNTNKFIVYNTYEQPYIEIIQNGQQFRLDSMLNKDKMEKYLSLPSRIFFGSQDKHQVYSNIITNDDYDIINWQGKKIIRIKNARNVKTKNALEIDYLIVSDKYLKKPSELLQYFHPKEIIIDGNIPLWKIDAFKNELAALDLPIHITPLEGAKIISL